MKKTQPYFQICFLLFARNSTIDSCQTSLEWNCYSLKILKMIPNSKTIYFIMHEFYQSISNINKQIACIQKQIQFPIPSQKCPTVRKHISSCNKWIFFEQGATVLSVFLNKVTQKRSWIADEKCNCLSEKTWKNTGCKIRMWNVSYFSFGMSFQ